MPENLLEINQYSALTSYCNTIGQSNNAFSILGFSFAEERRVHVLIFSSIAGHSGHVGGQEQKHLSPLGTKRHFYVNSSKKNSIVLIPTWPPCHVVENQELADKTNNEHLPQPFFMFIRKSLYLLFIHLTLASSQLKRTLSKRKISTTITYQYTVNLRL